MRRQLDKAKRFKSQIDKEMKLQPYIVLQCQQDNYLVPSADHCIEQMHGILKNCDYIDFFLFTQKIVVGAFARPNCVAGRKLDLGHVAARWERNPVLGLYKHTVTARWYFEERRS